jgi:uncharacterized membrane protein YdjX (TVP38/TMEM64 family)
MRRILTPDFWLKRRGNLAWDGVVYGSGLLALFGIAILLLGSDDAGGLVGFGIITVWVNGPLGMLLPATYEPILMLFGTLYPPLLIGFVGILGTLYIEGLNYYLYRTLLHTQALAPTRRTAVVRWTTRIFERAPFFTVWLCSWSPLPYWSVRILAPLAGYPIHRYLAATLLGRFPRLWFFAWLGPTLNLSPTLLLFVTLGSITLFALVFAWKARDRIFYVRRMRSPAPAFPQETESREPAVAGLAERT